MTATLGIPFIFKASFDKANRSSRRAFADRESRPASRRSRWCASKSASPCSPTCMKTPRSAEVAEVVDVLQTPAFLCRQTNFIIGVASQGKPVNIKKGQFLSPWEMQNVVDKARSTGNAQIMVCERGFSFGYNNLVSDMRSLAVMRATGCPVVFDATHSVQLPGGQGHASGRTARIRSGAGACGGRGGRRRPFHGDASRSGQSPVGRAQCVAARSHGLALRRRWSMWILP